MCILLSCIFLFIRKWFIIFRAKVEKDNIKPITTNLQQLQIKRNAALKKALEELWRHQKLLSENPDKETSPKKTKNRSSSASSSRSNSASRSRSRKGSVSSEDMSENEAEEGNSSQDECPSSSSPKIARLQVFWPSYICIPLKHKKKNVTMHICEFPWFNMDNKHILIAFHSLLAFILIFFLISAWINHWYICNINVQSFSMKLSKYASVINICFAFILIFFCISASIIHWYTVDSAKPATL